jgi:hypothetical protein
MLRGGPVKVMPGRRFFWIYKQKKRYDLASETEAKAKFHQLIEERARTYSKLPLGSRIH